MIIDDILDTRSSILQERLFEVARTSRSINVIVCIVTTFIHRLRMIWLVLIYFDHNQC